MISLKLSESQKGSDLIEIVHGAMKELEGDGWRIKKKSNRKLIKKRYKINSDNEVVRYSGKEFHINSFVPLSNLTYIGCSKPNEDHRIKSKCVVGLVGMQTLMVGTSVVSLGYMFPIALSIQLLSLRDGSESLFVINDAFFTLINPKQNYNWLNIYANKSIVYSADNTVNDHGIIESVNSTGFEVIKYKFNQFKNSMQKYLDISSPYRD